MLQLNILTGGKAGTRWVARRFPVLVGRSPQAALVLEDPGVWDRHLEITSNPSDGMVVSAGAEAIVSVNGQPTRQTALRAGDIIELGSVKLRFDLAPTRQASLTAREVLTWTGLILFCLGQVALVYWLTN